MIEWMIRMSEARLFFRRQLAKFVESLAEPNLFLTDRYWPAIDEGEIFVHEQQQAHCDELQPGGQLVFFSDHQVHIAFGGVPANYEERARMVAEQIERYLRSLSERTFDFESFTMKVRSFEGLSDNIGSTGATFVIQGYSSTLYPRK